MEDQHKYLLYIDILGFSELVNQDVDKVRDLYQLISELNARQHPVFETIIFSDTILVYNRTPPQQQSDHGYLVMYLCEFCQDLLFRLEGTGLHFRAVLRRGEFYHEAIGKSTAPVNAFFGQALVASYEAEKRIKAVGLFMDETCLPFSRIFHAMPFTPTLSYVFLTQKLLWVHDQAGGNFPLDNHFDKDRVSYLLDGTDTIYLKNELAWLKEVHRKTTALSLAPEVRAKFQMTFSFYEQRCAGLVAALKQSDFSPCGISAQYDWTGQARRDRPAAVHIRPADKKGG